MIRVLILIGALGPTLSHFADQDKWAQLTPQMRQWFQHQRNQTGVHCCDDSEMEQVEEDMQDGHYRVRSERTGGKWIAIDDWAVIKEGNKYGAPVVWWYTTNGTDLIARCFIPGAGT